MAWFRVREDLNVSQMNLGMASDYDFEIGIRSGKDITYYDKIDDDILQSSFPSYHPEKGLNDVSSMCQDLWLNDDTDPETDYPEFRTNFASAANKKTGSLAHSGFFQFEFFVRSSAGGYLFLNSNTWVKAEHEANEKKATEIPSQGIRPRPSTADDLDKIADCARFSFYTEMGYTIYEPNVATSSKTPFAGILDVSPVDSYYDTDSGKKEILYGAYNDDATIYYGDPLEEATDLVGDSTCFNAGHQKGASPIDFAKSQSEGNLQFEEEQSYSLSELAFDGASSVYDPTTMHPLGYCKPNEPMRLVVSVYLEGWDRDMTDYVSYGAFSANLAFSMLHSSRIS